MGTPDEITADGFDKQMQTNHLSPFLLTKELLPLLKASAKRTGDARIVQHSSIARDENPGDKMLKEEYFTKKEKDGMLGGDIDRANFMQGPQWYRYGQTKLANSVFTQALHEKLAASGDADFQNVLSLCAHDARGGPILRGRIDGSAQGHDGHEEKRQGGTALRPQRMGRIPGRNAAPRIRIRPQVERNVVANERGGDRCNIRDLSVLIKYHVA